ncbi:MAG: metal-dependent hydrolase [Gemmatimonadota bacterium]|nr:metal-dependent hydrolase [Gemmatimonadota bacterium]
MQASHPRRTIRAVENITHSLVGAALAELALPPAATPVTRRAFFAAGIVAANLPDADLLYSGITAPPLGYLLHHRGYTHTLVGLIGLALIFALVARIPAVRRAIGPPRRRFAVLVGLALLSHIVLDSWNSYGVHPFWPFDNRWFYGDAIFIAEPWLWVLLGCAVALNTRRPALRAIVAALLVALVVALRWFGQVDTGVLTALLIAAAFYTAILSRFALRTRAQVALGATALFVAGMFGASHVVAARGRSEVALAPGARVVDVVTDARMGDPLCWTALVIARNSSADDYAMTRGSMPLVNSVRCGAPARGQVVWTTSVHQSIRALRHLERDDCRVHAWLQFGRAPVIEGETIGDFRFGGAERGNFTAMSIAPPIGACPQHLTNWTFPRADLLD